jgi:hypothetical protein
MSETHNAHRETKVTKRVNNKDMSHYTTYRLPFENHPSRDTQQPTVWGEWQESQGNHLYIVYSYGHHFPLYIYDEQAQAWCGNSDYYSQTTSRHKTLAKPQTPNEFPRYGMMLMHQIIHQGGIAGAIARRIEDAVNP